MRTNNSHVMPSLGIEPGPHWWEASALTTASTLLPILGSEILGAISGGAYVLHSSF